MISDSLCVAMKVPRHAAKQIHEWARSQSWPEDTQLEHPREYHVTLLFAPEGYREHKDTWWIKDTERVQAQVVGLEIFTSTHSQDKGGHAYVLQLQAPELTEVAQELQDKAKMHGLSITDFPGGYKPHVTVGYGPSPRLTGIDEPNFAFDVGPLVVLPPKPKKTASEAPKPPNYRHGTEQKNCANCKMFDKGRCWGYGNRLVKAQALCDSWAKETQSSLREVMNQDTDYGDIWVDDKKKIVYLNVGDAFGDIIDEATDEAKRAYRGYKIEVLDEGGRPPNTRVAYNPEETQILDHLSLANIAHNLHYKYQEGATEDFMVGYAKRLLKLVGYPIDDITVKAAIQAWQTLYPKDQMSTEALDAPPTVPTESWGYGTTGARKFSPYNKDCQSLTQLHTADYFPGPFDTSWIKSVDPVPGNHVGVRMRTPGISEHLGTMSGGRGTGHFGTGVYFASSPEVFQREHSHGPLYGIDLTGYNLYRPWDFRGSIGLHDSLRDINRLAELQPGEGVPRSFGPPDDENHLIDMASIRLPGPLHRSEGAIRQALQNTRQDIANLGGWQNRFKAGYQYDSASTRVMRALGYDGIDTRHIPGMDNTMYGSVLYRPLRQNDTGVLAGAGRISRNQIGYTSPELTSIIDAFGRQYGATLLADEDADSVTMVLIVVPPNLRGHGVGSRLMNKLKYYCDHHNKKLDIMHVVNHPFFASLGWLNPRGPDEFSYEPSAADTQQSTVPTQVNDPNDHWPDVGDRPPDQKRDIQFSNDWEYSNF